MNPVETAVEIIERYGMIDGAHHKQWILDQILRTLLGDGYEKWIEKYNVPEYQPWDTGITP
jgi:hypothetical protein